LIVLRSFFLSTALGCVRLRPHLVSIAAGPVQSGNSVWPDEDITGGSPHLLKSTAGDAMVFDLPGLAAHLQIALSEQDLATSTAPIQILGVNTVELATSTDLCFAEHLDQADQVAASKAGVILVTESFPKLAGPLLIRVPEPRRSFFSVAECFIPSAPIPHRHSSAQVDTSASIGADVSIGACAVIAAEVRIGARCVIGPGCWIGPGVRIGDDCLLEANVTVHAQSSIGAHCVIRSGTVIGSDGFGFRWDGQRHCKIPQLGRVVIEDDVDIGCNCCVDRATLGETRVRRGARIDNLVQIAHNSDIGEHVILVSQSGIAGSSRVGTGAVLSGQVAVSDHVDIGAGARVGGQSGVTKDVSAGSSVFGTPARPIKDSLRQLAALSQLPRLLAQIKHQKQELKCLRDRLQALEGVQR